MNQLVISIHYIDLIIIIISKYKKNYIEISFLVNFLKLSLFINLLKLKDIYKKYKIKLEMYRI